MRCRYARRSLVDRREGRLSPAAERELDRHLEGCAACAREGRWEAELARDLALLHRERPVRVEVSSRVLRELDAAGEPDRRLVPLVEIRRAGVLAGAMVVLLAVAGVFVGWSLPEALSEAGRLLGMSSAVLQALAGPLAAALTTVRALTTAGGQLVEVFWVLARKTAPLAPGVIGLVLVLMTALTTAIVGRDLRTVPLTAGAEER